MLQAPETRSGPGPGPSWPQRGPVPAMAQARPNPGLPPWPSWPGQVPALARAHPGPGLDPIQALVRTRTQILSCTSQAIILLSNYHSRTLQSQSLRFHFVLYYVQSSEAGTPEAGIAAETLLANDLRVVQLARKPVCCIW